MYQISNAVMSFPILRDGFEALEQERAVRRIMAEASNRPNSTVYIGGLHPTLITSAVLSEAFIPFGEIADISLPKPEAPSSTDLHRGFGYVEFEEAGDAKEAVNNMDQSELYGRVIKVAMAKPERKAEEAGGIGSKTAIWEQVRPLLLRRARHQDYQSVADYCLGRISGRICSKRGRPNSSTKFTARCKQ